MTKKYDEYIYKRPRKNKLGFFFLLVLICVGLVVALNIADIISSLIMNKGSIFYNSKYYISAKNYYAISAGSFRSQDEANTLASSVRQKGGAGYVHLSGDYYVFLSLYSSQIDANNVKDKLKEDGVNASIININVPRLTVSFASGEKDAYKMSEEFLKTYDFLYDLSIKYDSGSIDYDSVISSINSKINSLGYCESVNAKSKEVITIKEKAKAMIQKLKSLAAVESGGYTLNSAIKSVYFDIVFDYIRMCKSISWFYFLKLLNYVYERIHRDKRAEYCQKSK